MISFFILSNFSYKNIDLLDTKDKKYWFSKHFYSTKEELVQKFRIKNNYYFKKQKKPISEWFFL